MVFLGNKKNNFFFQKLVGFGFEDGVTVIDEEFCNLIGIAWWQVREQRWPTRGR